MVSTILDLPLVVCNLADAYDRTCERLNQAVAVRLGELERAYRVLLRLRVLFSGSKRLRPAEMRPRRPQQQAVVVVEAARERERLVGLVVSLHRRRRDSEPQAHMAVHLRAAPD